MDEEGQRHPSHVFTLHLWQEDLGSGQTEWRGKLLDVRNRETHYFREWQTLIHCYLAY
jgi:hypothetical protein